MSEPFQYAVEVRWSETDECFLARVPELPGCLGDGTTAVKAVEQALEAAREWLATARELKRPIPPPATVEVAARHARSYEKMQMEKLVLRIQQAIEPQIAKMLQDAARQMADPRARGGDSPSPILSPRFNFETCLSDEELSAREC